VLNGTLQGAPISAYPGRLATERNVGRVDRIGRIVLAAAFLPTGYRNRDRTCGSMAFVAAGDLLATAAGHRCPVNAMLEIDVCGRNSSVPDVGRLERPSRSAHSSGS